MWVRNSEGKLSAGDNRQPGSGEKRLKKSNFGEGLVTTPEVIV
jgi:hypothetical protein